MLILPPNVQEAFAYRQTVEKDRWIYNKLVVSEQLGYHCGPSLTIPERAGKYVFRPIMNFAGEGYGGVLEFSAPAPRGQNLPYDHMPGWFWCEKFEGVNVWVNYTDDQPVEACVGVMGDPETMSFLQGDPSEYPMPMIFRGISRHMLLEFIDGNVIEAAPRHFRWTRGRAYGVVYKRREARRDDDHVLHHMKGFYWEEV